MSACVSVCVRAQRQVHLQANLVVRRCARWPVHVKLFTIREEKENNRLPSPMQSFVDIPLRDVNGSGVPRTLRTTSAKKRMVVVGGSLVCV